MTARLSVRSDDGSHFELEVGQSPVRIGRRSGVELRLPHPSVSLNHATLVCEGNAWFVTDEGSSNGTWISDSRLPVGERVRLAPGTTLRIGLFEVIPLPVFVEGSATRTESTEQLTRRLVEQALLAISPRAPLPRIEGLAGPARGLRRDLTRHAAKSWIIGRASACDISIDDPDLSREHARLRVDGVGTYVADLDSKNGVHVGPTRIVEERRLHDGDEITVGSSRIRFRDPAEAYLLELESVPDRLVPQLARRDARWRDYLVMGVGLAASVAGGLLLLWLASSG